MQIKKYLFFTRYILILFFITYLVLIWMYFKDNVINASSMELLNGFFVIPLLILALIVIVHLQYKKKKESTEDYKHATNNSDATSEHPISYEVFIHSYVCLPEGEHFIDITENSDDLTVLSSEYTSFDNLPILIKPIAKITSDNDEVYLHNDNIDSITKRIYLITRHLLTQNERELIKVTDYFSSQLDTELDKNLQNLTLSMHPKWQQSHILGENYEIKSGVDTVSPSIKLSTLTTYLVIPDLANKSFIKEYLIKQLISYGFSEDIIDIRCIAIESSNNIDSYDNPTPLGIIKDHIINISKSADSQLSLVIAVDSQINNEWLEAHYFTSANPSSIVPEEAGALLFLCNAAAKSFVEFDKYTATSLIEFSAQSASKLPMVQEPANATHYASNIRSISKFLQQDLLTNSERAKEADRTDDELPLAPFNLTILSDLSPLAKPYNVNVFMRLIDDLIEKGAGIDEHHLGGYLASNEWMTHLISLSLYADIENDEEDMLNKTLLITHDKTETLLWITSTTVTI